MHWLTIISGSEVAGHNVTAAPVDCARAEQPGVAEICAAQPGVAQVRAAQPDPLWKSRADIQAHGSTVSTKRAHKFMSDWRTKTTDTEEMERDLTDRADFDWVGYLKSHPDIASIVPNGKLVVIFAIVRLAVIDRNTKSGRVDFVLLLDDGHHVRLHPSHHKKQFRSSCLQIARVSS